MHERNASRVNHSEGGILDSEALPSESGAGESVSLAILKPLTLLSLPIFTALMLAPRVSEEHSNAAEDHLAAHYEHDVPPGAFVLTPEIVSDMTPERVEELLKEAADAIQAIDFLPGFVKSKIIAIVEKPSTVRDESGRTMLEEIFDVLDYDDDMSLSRHEALAAIDAVEGLGEGDGSGLPSSIRAPSLELSDRTRKFVNTNWRWIHLLGSLANTADGWCLRVNRSEIDGSLVAKR